MRKATLILSLVIGVSTIQCDGSKLADQTSMPNYNTGASWPDKVGDWMLHVKCRKGADIDAPLLLLPPEWRNSIVSITPLFTLGDHQLNKMAAERLRRWFNITLKSEADVDLLLENLKDSDDVEIVERAPRPAPPPAH